MENFSGEHQKNQEAQESRLQEAYDLLGAHTPLELEHLYDEADQSLMKSGEWDYDNPELVTNKIKDILEQIDPSLLTEKEAEWRQEILWFWYHHAISCAIWEKNDREAAKLYAEKALEVKPVDAKNQITQLLYFLVHDKVKEAEEWIENIPDRFRKFSDKEPSEENPELENPEKNTGEELLAEYKEGKWFL